MKRKLSPEERRLWESQIKDVKPLPKITAKPKETQGFPTKPIKKPQRTAALEKELRKPLPASPPQSLGRKNLRRIQIDGRIDLHGMSLETAYQALERFLIHAQERGFKMVLVITGKGAVSAERTLRSALPLWLKETPLRHLVASLYHPAKPQDGGQGAYYVGVRRRRKD
jgi:DNA-nicking Smr family endonuclease